MSVAIAIEAEHYANPHAAAPSAPQCRADFLAAGFVRVDGLKCRRPFDGEETLIRVISEERLGRYDYNNGKFCFTLLNGEIWIGMGTPGEIVEQLVGKYAPNGRGCNVPLSNGEAIELREVLLKASDPSYVSR